MRFLRFLKKSQEKETEERTHESEGISPDILATLGEIQERLRPLQEKELRRLKVQCRRFVKESKRKGDIYEQIMYLESCKSVAKRIELKKLISDEIDALVATMGTYEKEKLDRMFVDMVMKEEYIVRKHKSNVYHQTEYSPVDVRKVLSNVSNAEDIYDRILLLEDASLDAKNEDAIRIFENKLQEYLDTLDVEQRAELENRRIQRMFDSTIEEKKESPVEVLENKKIQAILNTFKSEHGDKDIFEQMSEIDALLISYEGKNLFLEGITKIERIYDAFDVYIEECIKVERNPHSQTSFEIIWHLLAQKRAIEFEDIRSLRLDDPKLSVLLEDTIQEIENTDPENKKLIKSLYRLRFEISNPELFVFRNLGRENEFSKPSETHTIILSPVRGKNVIVDLCDEDEEDQSALPLPVQLSIEDKVERGESVDEKKIKTSHSILKGLVDSFASIKQGLLRGYKFVVPYSSKKEKKNINLAYEPPSKKAQEEAQKVASQAEYIVGKGYDVEKCVEMLLKEQGDKWDTSVVKSAASKISSMFSGLFQKETDRVKLTRFMAIVADYVRGAVVPAELNMAVDLLALAKDAYNLPDVNEREMKILEASEKIIKELLESKKEVLKMNLRVRADLEFAKVIAEVEELVFIAMLRRYRNGLNGDQNLSWDDAILSPANDLFMSMWKNIHNEDAESILSLEDLSLRYASDEWVYLDANRNIHEDDLLGVIKARAELMPRLLTLSGEYIADKVGIGDVVSTVKAVYQLYNLFNSEVQTLPAGTSKAMQGN